MNRRRFAAVLVAAGVLAAWAPASRAQAPATLTLPASSVEAYRLRFANQAGGAIEASSDGGRTWIPLGKVTRPATTTTLYSGVLAIAAAGKVAGVNGDGILVRIPAAKGLLRAVRILAAGEVPSAAALCTDQPARSALFRALAPPIGSEIHLEHPGGTEPLPLDYTPHPGDRLVILVPATVEAETASVVIENKAGGEVVLSTPGGIPQPLARVKQPLRGIGRYAGTERGGSGSILSWMPSAVLVATAGLTHRSGEGTASEERGGFVIQPADATLQGTTHPASQLLIEAIGQGTTRPIVSRFFAQPAALSSGDPFDLAPTRVEVRIDGGAWEPMPDLRGTVDVDQLPRALEEALGGKRKVTSGITHLRILFGAVRPASLQRRIRLAAAPLSGAPQRGTVTITANVMGEGVEFVKFFLNGKLMQITNRRPYAWKWDTTGVPNGEHLVEIQGLDSKLTVISSSLARVRVDN